MYDQFQVSDNERLIIQAIRRARSNRKRPSTFVIRVVDGIVQFMVAQPEYLINSDICHLDNKDGVS
jgi:hypothetical protein